MIPVPVRFRSAALIKALDFQGFFYVVEDDIDKKYSFGYNKKENCYSGILAQLGEHLPYKQRVTGSSPVGPIS